MTFHLLFLPPNMSCLGSSRLCTVVPGGRRTMCTLCLRCGAPVLVLRGSMFIVTAAYLPRRRLRLRLPWRAHLLPCRRRVVTVVARNIAAASLCRFARCHLAAY